MVTRMSAARCMKPMNRESDDQNGYVAPSVPVSGCATSPSSGRTQSTDLPSGPAAMKVTFFPSGDSANRAGSSSDSVTCSGNGITAR